MFNTTLLFDSEFFIFIIIESLMILGYFIFARYSRNHGGVFDRRVDERRSQIRGIKFNHFDRRMFDIGFAQVKVELAGTNEVFNVDTNRRISERRELTDRRRI